LFSGFEEKTLACPICNKRKAKRQCPARAESICSICCGTEREVTIDCPSDCVHLVASREYNLTRQEFDWAKVPFAEVKFNRSFAETHGPLLVDLDYSVCQFAADHREVVDLPHSVEWDYLREASGLRAATRIVREPESGHCGFPEG
jgi:hypothetical protein